MKFKKAGLFVLGIVAVGVSLLYAANYVQRFTVAGSQVWLIDNDGSTMQSGPHKFGNNATATSVTVPTVTTGSNFSTYVPVYNVGAAATQGDVLIASNTGTGYVAVAPATTDLTSIVGVSAGSIASGAIGWMIPRGGGFAVVKTTGTVSIGDTLVSTSSAAGYLTGDATPTTGADVATAMSAGTAAGGTVLAILH